MNKTPKLRFKEFSGDWESNKLENISTKIGDGIHTTPSYIDSSEIKFINGNNIKNHKIVINENTKSISEEELKKYSIYLDNHSILMSINGTIGNVGYYNNEKVLLGKSVAYINVNPKAINKLFLGTLLETDKVQQRFMSELTGSTIKNLSLKSIRECKLSLPSIEEQEKIASLFSLIDDKISLQSEKLEMLKYYKKGMMQKIFSRELRFKDDEGRDYPEWEEKKLGDIIDKGKAGGTPKSTIKDYYNGNINFLSISDMTTQGKYINNTEKTITELGLENSSAWLVPKNSLIYSMYASVGFVSINNIELATSQAMFSMIINEKANIDYVYHYLSYFKENGVQSFIETGTQGNLNANTVKNIVIPYPTREEQNKISLCISSIESKISKEQEKLDSLNEYKKGLLQQMFV